MCLPTVISLKTPVFEEWKSQKIANRAYVNWWISLPGCAFGNHVACFIVDIKTSDPILSNNPFGLRIRVSIEIRRQGRTRLNYCGPFFMTFSANKRFIFASAISVFLMAPARGLIAQDKPAPGEKSLSEEMQRFPAVEPADALATFEVAAGFSLELVAAEPLVSDPVDACFDARGRMFVAEMHGYPYSHETRKQQPKIRGKKDAGIIRLLEDTNNDGRFDRSQVFADQLSWVTSVCCYKTGVFAIAPPHLYFLNDTNGDGKADTREIVASGFSKRNVQAVANNLEWGLDNYIYLAMARAGGKLSRNGKPLIDPGNRDLKLNPLTRELRAVDGGSQVGHCVDDFGNRFICSNSNHIQHVAWRSADLSRRPLAQPPAIVRNIAKEGGAAPVFRRSPAEPWRIVRTRRRAHDPKFNKRLPATELVPIGFFTSATGLTVYRGDAFPSTFQNNVFIGDVGGNLVHRKFLKSNGISFTAQRADAGREFIASTDTWFRPVNFVNGPDGNLYLLDMYRETIEHPVSIPEDIKAHVDLQSGDDRGRVYRIVAPKSVPAKMRSNLAAANTTELIEALDSTNGWSRETAQRLLVEQQNSTAANEIRSRLRQHPQLRLTDRGMIHMLWTLRGLDTNGLNADDLLWAFDQPSSNVREQAILLATPDLTNTAINKWLMKFVANPDLKLRCRALLALVERGAETPLDLLAQTGLNATNTDEQTAVLICAGDRLAGLLQQLLQRKGTPSSAGFFRRAARQVGFTADEVELVNVLSDCFRQSSPGPDVLQSLNAGLEQRGRSIGEILLSHGELQSAAMDYFSNAARTASDKNQPLPARLKAIQTMSCADAETAKKSLAAFLEPTVSVVIQQAAIDAFSRQKDATVADELIDRWRGFSPAIRIQVTQVLTSRRAWSGRLIQAVESKQIRKNQLGPSAVSLLKSHPDRGIREKSRALFQSSNSTRATVVSSYTKKLGDGNADRGFNVYEKHCAVCHRSGHKGKQLGPDLVSVKNKSEQDLLVAILDPNRDALPQYHVYNAVTDSGQVVSGMLAAESNTVLTFQLADGKSKTIKRSALENLVATATSLMPEGLEKEISPAQMSDLLAFLKSALNSAPAVSK